MNHPVPRAQEISKLKRQSASQQSEEKKHDAKQPVREEKNKKEKHEKTVALEELLYAPPFIWKECKKQFRPVKRRDGKQVEYAKENI